MSTPLQTQFLALLPRLEVHARIAFRDVPCPHRKADFVAETVALAWTWFVRLAAKGRDGSAFPFALARYATQAVRSGRVATGQERSTEVLSSVAQRRHRFSVSPLPPTSCLHETIFDEALRDNTLTPVDEQVAFRLDFPAWRNTLTERDRRLTDELMLGERTLDIARRFGLSPGRVSQKRREFHDDWTRFCAAPGEDG